MATEVACPTERSRSQHLKTALVQGDEVVRETVNSDGDVMALLDDKAELRLRTPFNIFVGGNILDRGITIPSLIAFYHGRNPRTSEGGRQCFSIHECRGSS